MSTSATTWRGIARWGTVLTAVAAVLAVRAYTDQLAFGEIAVGARLAPLYAMIAVAPAVLLTAAGLVAHWSRPASRVGLLLVAEGLAWNLGTLTYAATALPAAAELSALVVFAGYAIGAQVLLAYPDGRLRERTDRVLAGLLYAVLGPGLVVTFLFHADFGPGCPLCPANGYLVTPHDGLDVAANAGWYAVAGLLIVLAGLRSVPRWRAAGPVARRSLAPIFLTRWWLVATIAVWCAIGAALAFGDTTVWGLRSQVLINVAAVAVSAGVVAMFLRSTAARGAAGVLARELRAADGLPPGRLEQSVRSALGDPCARLLFSHPGTRGWVGSDGHPTTPHPQRSITPVGPRSALEHDRALDDDPAVVDSVAAVAGFAIETERLGALLRARETGSENGDALADVLTAREREVLALAAEGLTDTAIAERLFLTRRTVETHLGHIFLKLDVPAGSASNRRVHAVRRFLQATPRP